VTAVLCLTYIILQIYLSQQSGYDNFFFFCGKVLIYLNKCIRINSNFTNWYKDWPSHRLSFSVILVCLAKGHLHSGCILMVTETARVLIYLYCSIPNTWSTKFLMNLFSLWKTHGGKKISFEEVTTYIFLWRPLCMGCCSCVLCDRTIVFQFTCYCKETWHCIYYSYVTCWRNKVAKWSWMHLSLSCGMKLHRRNCIETWYYLYCKDGMVYNIMMLILQ
jgi:hypothetical protein